MGVPIAIFLGLVYVRSLWRSALCLALLILLFGIKIVLQSQFGALQSETGSIVVNIVTGLVICASLAILYVRQGNPSGGFFNRASVLAITLYLWSIVTLAWSLDADAGLATVRSGWPYVVLSLVLVPITVRSLRDAGEALIWTRRIGFVLCLAVITSSEFTTKSGRIGIDLAASASSRSNPLVIGELGALQIMLGLLLTSGRRPTLEMVFRVASVLIGTLVVFKSGSRGQIFFAIGLGVLLFPISFRVANVRSFVVGAILIAILGTAAYLIVESVYSDWELRRFSLESMLYGASSAGSRFASILSMAQEWAGTPKAWLFGLGLNAYSALPLGTGDIYSHVVFADAIFELGLIGAALMTGTLWFAFRSCRTILAYGLSSDAQDRSVVGSLVALVTFHTLLINKQGALWGSHQFFCLVVVVTFLAESIPYSVPAARAAGSLPDPSDPSDPSDPIPHDCPKP